jgi:cytochrome P450
MTSIPASIISDADPFSPDHLADPYPLYRTLRDIGPVAYLRRYGVYFLGRYDQVRAALGDPATFSSAGGAGLNETVNNAWQGALICLDPPEHTALRKLFTDRLGPRHLKGVEATIHNRADELVARLAEQGRCDGVTEIAQDLPVNIIHDLIGWPEEVRGKLLELALGGFDACGPDNVPATQAAFPRLGEMMEFLNRAYDEDMLRPGGFGADITAAAKRGELSRTVAVSLLAGYIVAAFDTTINAIASGLMLFAHHPDQWQRVRENPALVPGAFLEIIRLETPLQCFARVTTRQVDYGDGICIPAGARVIVSYAAANRDERHYPDPDRFDVARNPLDHLGFGLGVHNCAGQSLAKLEGLAVFNALARRVNSITLDGPPQREVNNITRGLAHLPLRLA